MMSRRRPRAQEEEGAQSDGETVKQTTSDSEDESPQSDGEIAEKLRDTYQKQFGKIFDATVSETLHQNVSHIMSEKDKCISYSLEMNQSADLTQEEFESTHLGYNPKREPVGHHIR